MLDIGWTEILIILVLGLLVVGPKELPKLVRTIGKWRGKMSAYARDFQRSIEDAADVTEVDAIKKEIAEANRELNDAHRDIQEQAAGINEDMQRSTKDSTFVGLNSDASVAKPGTPEADESENIGTGGAGAAARNQGADKPSAKSPSVKSGESRENSANV